MRRLGRAVRVVLAVSAVAAAPAAALAEKIPAAGVVLTSLSLEAGDLVVAGRTRAAGQTVAVEMPGAPVLASMATGSEGVFQIVVRGYSRDCRVVLLVDAVPSTPFRITGCPPAN